MQTQSDHSSSQVAIKRPHASTDSTPSKEEQDASVSGTNITEEVEYSSKRRRAQMNEDASHALDPRSRKCPYLDTINRHLLDFDFEKLCSVSLTHLNVYACLVCGKYYQGRGSNTHAYTHSVDAGHHVFLNLETHKFYCLPDNYEVIDGSLEDITYLLSPKFSHRHITQLDDISKPVRAYHGNTYYPGIVGLNNIKANDYCNVILQMLSHVPLLRNFFLREENYADVRRPPGDLMIILVQRFGELLRKLWNPRNFKTHVSPHEFLQAVVLCSKKRFQFTRQGDAMDFLAWLLNALHASTQVAGKKTIISRAFRGRMLIFSRKVIPVELSDTEKSLLAATEEYQEHVEQSKFFYLTCDLPPPPLYTDEMKENIIPQVPMFTVLAKFNGRTEKEYPSHKDSVMKRFHLTRLPPFLILFMKRFVKNIFTLEKNPTIVNFPIRHIDFGELLTPEARRRHRHTTYDLIANVVHDGKPNEGSYRCHILQKGTGKWFEMQDLHVAEMLPEMIALSESLIQVWEVNTEIENPLWEGAQGGERSVQQKMNTAGDNGSGNGAVSDNGNPQ